MALMAGFHLRLVGAKRANFDFKRRDPFFERKSRYHRTSWLVWYRDLGAIPS
jgi:hypothetical protein